MSDNVKRETIIWDTKSKIHLGITIIVMIFIFIQSALPADLSGAESNVIVKMLSNLTGIEEEALSLIVRKLAHFTEFMILGICLAVNVKDILAACNKTVHGFKMSALPWLIGTIYAVTDEVHQLFVPGRACAFLDICIDSSGVAAGVLIILILARRVAKAGPVPGNRS